MTGRESGIGGRTGSRCWCSGLSNRRASGDQRAVAGDKRREERTHPFKKRKGRPPRIVSRIKAVPPAPIAVEGSGLIRGATCRLVKKNVTGRDKISFGRRVQEEPGSLNRSYVTSAVSESNEYWISEIVVWNLSLGVSQRRPQQKEKYD